MTSLAKQLERLAIPGQPSLRQLVSKKRPSLLFDAREAADMDVETVFSLGRNGLEELIRIDPTFSQFEPTLFQESCKEFERSVQTSDVLVELDKIISAFLRRLSPYFLLKPAQKCLEWLIRVYRVQSCNTDGVMECILPYYETKLFARVVQLLPLKSSSSAWHWLRPLQRAGSPLSRLSLVQHCVSVPSFLVFVCEMVPKSISVHRRCLPGSLRNVLALYCSTTVLVLNTESGTSEEIIGRLLPYLLKGLKSHVADYRAASYIILGQLVSKATLEEQLTTSLLEATTKHLGSELSQEGMCCAAVICHTQNISELSSKTVRNMLRVPSLSSLLSSLSSTHNVSPVLRLLLSALINTHFDQFGNHDDSAAMTTTLSLLDEIPLNRHVVTSLISDLLDHFVRRCVKGEGREGEGEDGGVMALKNSIAPLAQSLDAKYPKQMDKALQMALVNMAAKRMKVSGPEKEEEEEEGEGGSEVGEEVKWVHEFITSSLPGSRHQVVQRVGKRRRSDDGEGSEGRTLVLSVHHPQPSVRAAAVRQLGLHLKHRNKKGSSYDSEFASSCLVSRLQDEEPAVVTAVLELGEKVLTCHVPPLSLLPPLSSILARPNLSLGPLPWQQVALSALSLITSRAVSEAVPERVDDIIITSLPLLFVHRRGNKLAERVAGVLCEVEHVLLEGLGELMEDEVWRSGCSPKCERNSAALAAANSSLIEHLGARLAQTEDSLRSKLVTALLCKATSSSPDTADHFVYVGMLVIAMATDSTHPQFWLRPALSLLQYTQNCITEVAQLSPPSLPSPTPSLPDVLRPMTRKRAQTTVAHSLLLLWFLDTLVTHLPIVEVQTDMWLCVPGNCEGGAGGEDGEGGGGGKGGAGGEGGAGDEQCYHAALLSLFSIITGCMQWAAETAKSLLHGLLKTHLSNNGYLLRFLAMMWTTPATAATPHSSVLVTVTTQSNSLALFSSYLKCLPTESVLGLTTHLCPVVPSLLIPLTSPHRPIRLQALSCLSLLQRSPSQLSSSECLKAYTANPMLYLLDVLVESELSLSSDPSSLPHLLGQVFSVEEREGGGKSRQKTLGSGYTSLPGRSRHRTKKKLEQRAKVAVLDSILSGMLTHIVALSPPPHIQSSLLTILAEVDRPFKVSATQPLLRQLLDKCSPRLNQQDGPALSPHEAVTLQLCLACLTPSVAAGFLETFLESSDTHHSFQLLLRALSLTSSLSPSLPSPMEMALQQVTPAFFSALPTDSLKLNLLNSLLSILTTTQRSEVAVMVKRCFKKLDLSADLLVDLFTSHSRTLNDPLTTPVKKKQKHVKEVPPPASHSTNEQGHTRGWKVITVLLELLQDSSSSSLTDHHLLTPHYFNLLDRCLQAEDSERFQLEYTQQLLLSALLSICDQLTRRGIEEAQALMPDSVFNMELVVKCIRLSSNPLTHHHALLLLTSAAALYPNRVLHNIMPVFTFMGSSLLRKDDQYSFQIITQTLDSVIPPLIQSGSSVLPTLTTPRTPHTTTPRKPRPQRNQQVTTVEGVVTEIIRIFVDAIPHTPDHRRLPLLSHLLLRVGPAQFLSVALGLLVVKHVQQLGVKEQTPKEAVLSISFSVSVAQLFPVEQQLQAVAQLLAYITSLPLEKPHSARSQLSSSVNQIFNVATHSQKQLQQFKYSCSSLTSSLLSHNTLVEQVSCVEEEALPAVEETIHSILQRALDYEATITSHSTQKSDKTTKSNSSQKLTLSLVNKIGDIIGHVTSLLTPTSLVSLVMHLLCVSGEEVKVKVLRIVAGRLEDGQRYFSSDHDGCLVELLSSVVGVAKNDSSHLLTRHSAVYCVKLLARWLSHKHHAHLTQALQEMLTLLSNSDSLSSELIGGCLLAVADISSSLGPHLIPILPPTLPPVLERVGGSVGVMVRMSAVMTLGVIVQTLPKFLSSFSTNIVKKLCQLEEKSVEGAGKERLQLAAEAALTREKVATLVPPRTLVRAYTKVYPLLCPLGKGALLALLEMLKHTVSSLTQEDARSLAPQLGDLFTTCLNHRAHQEEALMEDVETVEEKCVEAFTHLVVHLSETLFRPMFLKLLDWATHRGASDDRLTSFYHLADGVARKLKGLFLLFAGHFVKNAASILENTNLNTQDSQLFSEDPLRAEKTCCLLSHLLSCLHKCFLHSQTAPASGFLTRERFDTLMPPLVHQISNVMGGDKAFKRRVETSLSLCLAQLAVAAGREELWKPLNHQILLKTRHESAEVRYAAVVVLKKMYSKLGNEFMSLLPETIPFLAELLEDESEEVEQETQSLIVTIETQLGESIQQYFQ